MCRPFNAVCLTLAFFGALGSASIETENAGRVASDVQMGVTSQGKMKVSREGTQFQGRQQARQIMRHEAKRDDTDTVPVSQDVDWDSFHQIDGGPNCPMVPLIQYPTRYEKSSMLCLDDSTEHLGTACHIGTPTAGTNRVVFAYAGKVNTSDHVERYAKVYTPVGQRELDRPTEGWPVMIIFHATLPLNTANHAEADDEKAPEMHFDGILRNEELDSVINRMITIVPAGYDRYRFDGPDECKAEKYTAEFNYLQSSLGRTRHSNADEVKFLAAIMSWLHIAGQADLSQIYVTGHATGAHMVFSMMSQYQLGTPADHLEFSVAGGSASAGSFLTCLNDPRVAHGDNGDWSNLSPTPFMYFQGLQDVTSWCGGGGYYRHQGEHMYSMEQMASSYAQRNRCAMTPEGGYKIKHWELSRENDTLLDQRANLWEFEDCLAPLVVYTFPGMDHILQSMNTFMFKQKALFFLKEWVSPTELPVRKVLNTKDGSSMCGCCNEATGQCDYTSSCDSKQYLETVSCPGVSEMKDQCWHSSNLADSPVCWWIDHDAMGNAVNQ